MIHRLLALLLLAAACGKSAAPAPAPQAHVEALSHEHQHHAQHAHAEHAEHTEHQHQVLPGTVPSPNSLYQLQATLRDQDGQSLGLDHFRGHIVLVGMFYSSCTNICPMLVARAKSLREQLDPEARKQVKVMLVSLDPKRDDPAALKALARTHQVDEPSWRFSAGSEDATREIAAALGIRYREMAGGEINHTPVLAVLDGEGNVRSRTEDFGDSSQLLAALIQLTK
jgi:protein SCO1/2